MKPGQPLTLGAQISVAAIVVLGMIGGALIMAHSGFNTLPRRGGSSVHVPAPEAYILAAIMFGMSVIGMIALVWERRKSVALSALSVLLYIVVAVEVISRIRPG